MCMDLNMFWMDPKNTAQKQRHFKRAPVGLDPRSPLLTDPWPCRASRAASELLPEMTPHPTRLCVVADCDPSPPPPLLPPRLLPLWTNTDC